MGKLSINNRDYGIGSSWPRSSFVVEAVVYFIFILQIQRVTKPLDIEHVRKVQYKGINIQENNIKT
jgi:hypothetical protein